MKSIHLPMLVSGSSVFLARQAGGFDLRACPDGEELAAFVVYACSNHDDLVASNNQLRDQVQHLQRDMEGLLAAGKVLAEDIVHKQAVQAQLVQALSVFVGALDEKRAANNRGEAGFASTNTMWANLEPARAALAAAGAA